MPIDDNRSHRSLEINCTKYLQKVPNYFVFCLNSQISCAIEMMFMSVRKAFKVLRQPNELSVDTEKCMYVKIMHKTRQLINQHLRIKINKDEGIPGSVKVPYVFKVSLNRFFI